AEHDRGDREHGAQQQEGLVAGLGQPGGIDVLAGGGGGDQRHDVLRWSVVEKGFCFVGGGEAAGSYRPPARGGVSHIWSPVSAASTSSRPGHGCLRGAGSCPREIERRTSMQVARDFLKRRESRSGARG